MMKERKKEKTNKQVADVREEETEEPGGAERGRAVCVDESLWFTSQCTFKHATTILDLFVRCPW